MSPNSGSLSKSKSFVKEEKSKSSTKSNEKPEVQKEITKKVVSDKIPEFFVPSNRAKIEDKLNKISTYFSQEEITIDSATTLLNELTGLHEFFCILLLRKIANFTEKEFLSFSFKKALQEVFQYRKQDKTAV